MTYFELHLEQLFFKIAEKVKDYDQLIVLLSLRYGKKVTPKIHMLFYRYVYPKLYVNLKRLAKVRLIKKFKWDLYLRLVLSPEGLPEAEAEDVLCIRYLTQTVVLTHELAILEGMLEALPIKQCADIVGVDRYKKCYHIIKLLELLINVGVIQASIYADIMVKIMNMLSYSPASDKINLLCRNIMIRLMSTDEFILCHKDVINRIYDDDEIHPEYYRKYIKAELESDKPVNYKVVTIVLGDYVCRRKPTDGVYLSKKILKGKL